MHYIKQCQIKGKANRNQSACGTRAASGLSLHSPWSPQRITLPRGCSHIFWYLMMKAQHKLSRRPKGDQLGFHPGRSHYCHHSWNVSSWEEAAQSCCRSSHCERSKIRGFLSICQSSYISRLESFQWVNQLSPWVPQWSVVCRPLECTAT